MGFKQIALLKAKAGMKRDAFIRRYEDGHVPLVTKLIPFFSDYRRSFIKPDRSLRPAHVTESGPLFVFDVLTELWFSGEDTLAALFEMISTTDAGAQIDEDEKHFFDRTQMIMFGTDERRTPQSRLAQRPSDHIGRPAVKMYALLHKRNDMSHEQFIDYYESNHSELALRLLARNGTPLFSDYARNYPIASECKAIGERSGSTPIPCDALTEICFWTEADCTEFMDLCARPDIAKALSEDEAKFFDRETVCVLSVDEYVSPKL